MADELFFILEGEGQHRFGTEVQPVRAGDFVAAPAGTVAHQLVNTGTAPLRYLAISTVGSVDVIDYPDSGKIAFAAGVRDADLSTATLKALGRVVPADYFEGEEPKG